MKSEILLCLFLIVSLELRSQGLILNDTSYNSAPRTRYDGEGAKGEADILKNKFKVDLKPFCPTVREQGKISSCVGWSVGYAAMTIEKAVADNLAYNQKFIDDNAYSAMFVYNQIKLSDCSFGAELNNAFSFLKENGNVLYRDFAPDNNCDSIPLEKLRKRARLNRVSDFATLFGPDDRNETKIERVKITLAHNKPVVVGMVILDNFLTLKSTDHMWYPNVGKTTLFGGHAMVVIGYDDGLQAFEVMNSWGRGWANNGFAWIRYDDFARYCKYAYQLVLAREDDGYLEGGFQVRKPVLKPIGEEDIVFSQLPFIYKDNHYEFNQLDARLPIRFQLVAEGLRKDSYLYVISFDRAMKPTIHWPRNEKLNRQFSGEQHSAQVTEENHSITVPGKYSVFTITEPGVEYLCVLNAASPIKNLPDKLAQLKNVTNDFPGRVQRLFEGKKVNTSSVFYTHDRISFYAYHREIVMVLLAFDTR